jgi:hypothetical protein
MLPFLLSRRKQYAWLWKKLWYETSKKEKEKER